MIKKSILSLSFAMVFLSSGDLTAGVQMDGVQTTDEASIHFSMRIENQKIRMESTGDDFSQIMIFNTEKQTFYFINPDKKMYSTMTRDQRDSLMGQAQAALALVEQQLKSLPPEQAAMMKEMISSQFQQKGITKPEEKIMWKKTGTEQVGSWNCSVYTGTQGQAKVSESYVVPTQKMGLTAKDIESIAAMNTFLSEFSEGMTSPFLDIPSASQGDAQLPGMPVKTISYTGGRKTGEMLIQKVSKQTFKESLFEIPDGYVKKEMWPRH